jgi:hypothetical protein
VNVTLITSGAVFLEQNTSTSAPLEARMRTVKIGSKIVSRLRSTLATALIIWCAGAGCMMVSYARGEAMRAETSKTSSPAGWGQASGSAGAHDCCKARHASERRAALSRQTVTTNFEELGEVPNSSDTMSCCPLTSGTFVISSRQTVSNENALANHDAGVHPVVVNMPARFHARPLRLPNQDQTYLRDCVFLI